MVRQTEELIACANDVHIDVHKRANDVHKCAIGRAIEMTLISKMKTTFKWAMNIATQAKDRTNLAQSVRAKKYSELPQNWSNILEITICDLKWHTVIIHPMAMSMTTMTTKKLHKKASMIEIVGSALSERVGERRKEQ